jgi:hypothetical protein
MHQFKYQDKQDRCLKLSSWNKSLQNNHLFFVCAVQNQGGVLTKRMLSLLNQLYIHKTTYATSKCWIINKSSVNTQNQNHVQTLFRYKNFSAILKTLNDNKFRGFFIENLSIFLQHLSLFWFKLYHFRDNFY